MDDIRLARRRSTQRPVWFSVLGVLALSAPVAKVASDRGLAAGAFAAGIFCLVMIPAFIHRERAIAWSRQHPVLDALTVVPFLFVSLAYLTELTTLACALAGLAVGVVFVALSAALRVRRRSRNRSVSRSRELAEHTPID